MPDEIWRPKPGLGGLLLSQAIMVSLIAKKVLSPEEAHGLLDETLALLEDWKAHAGFGALSNDQIAAAYSDIAYLKKHLQKFPQTRLLP